MALTRDSRSRPGQFALSLKAKLAAGGVNVAALFAAQGRRDLLFLQRLEEGPCAASAGRSHARPSTWL